MNHVRRKFAQSTHKYTHTAVPHQSVVIKVAGNLSVGGNRASKVSIH